MRRWDEEGESEGIRRKPAVRILRRQQPSVGLEAPLALSRNADAPHLGDGRGHQRRRSGAARVIDSAVQSAAIDSQGALRTGLRAEDEIRTRDLLLGKDPIAGW